MARILRTYKYCIYPTTAQENQLNQQLDLCRYVYNKVLEARKNAYEQDRKLLSLYAPQARLPTWKSEKPARAKVNAQVIQNVNIRVDLAFKAFFRRVKTGEEGPGYPRFKGYGHYDSMTFPQYAIRVVFVLTETP